MSAIIYNTSNGDVWKTILLAWNEMQKKYVIHYYIDKQILDSYLHTKSEQTWLLFTFVLNWVFLRFPWQRQAFWNFQASKPFIHMPYNISIKFYPIPSTLNFSRFLWQRAIMKFPSRFWCWELISMVWEPYYDPLCRNIHRSMWQLLGGWTNSKRRTLPW